MTPRPPLSRRTFLRSIGIAAAAAAVAACADAPPSNGRASAGASSGPSAGVASASGAAAEPPPSSAVAPASPSPSPAVASASPGPDLRTKIAGMLLVGFRGLTVAAASGTVADIRDRGLGGVVLFDYDTPTGTYGRNITSPAQDPAVVTGQGVVYLAGLHVAGVAGTLKHFPGHGSSTGDTHFGWVNVTRTWSSMELDPFRVIIAAGAADAVLVAHVFDAKLDPIYPASLSERVIGGILRDQLGFGGVVISDDLQMGAIRARFDYPTAVERAIPAGTDILTIANEQVHEPHVVATTVEIVAAAVAAGRISEARIDASWQRIGTFKAGRAGG